MLKSEEKQIIKCFKLEVKKLWENAWTVSSFLVPEHEGKQNRTRILIF